MLSKKSRQYRDPSSRWHNRRTRSFGLGTSVEGAVQHDRYRLRTERSAQRRRSARTGPPPHRRILRDLREISAGGRTDRHRGLRDGSCRPAPPHLCRRGSPLPGDDLLTDDLGEEILNTLDAPIIKEGWSCDMFGLI